MEALVTNDLTPIWKQPGDGPDLRSWNTFLKDNSVLTHTKARPIAVETKEILGEQYRGKRYAKRFELRLGTKFVKPDYQMEPKETEIEFFQPKS